jgi:hypothetical protein
MRSAEFSLSNLAAICSKLKVVIIGKFCSKTLHSAYFDYRGVSGKKQGVKTDPGFELSEITD